MSFMSASTACLARGEATLLSNLDLLEILVGNASHLIATYPTLALLDNASAQELSDIPGLDSQSVARLLAARELSRRRAMEKATRGVPVISPDDAVQILAPLVRDETREVVIALALDTKSRLVCSPITIAIGTNDSAPCHPREVFRPLIRVSASSAIIAHLHPSSGEPVPSPEDIMLTERLREAGALVGIPVVDHIVIGRGSYISMAERGLV